MNNTTKYTLVSADFNKKTGISTVIIKNEYGVFTGTAKLNPDDIPSSFTGCRIAEIRAAIKMLKRKIAVLKDRNKILSAVIIQRGYDDEKTNNIIVGMINNNLNTIKLLEDDINTFTDIIIPRIAWDREAFLDKINNK